MRRYVIGTIFGFVLATAVGANAQEVNKVIDSIVQGVFPVTVEGNSVGDAIVVNDKTYLPVREFGEAVGYKVTFTEDREVVLTKNTDSSATPVATNPITSDKTVSEQISDLKRKIAEEKSSIEQGQAMITENEASLEKPNFPKESVKQAIDMYKKQVLENEKRIADYEAKLAALKSQQ